MQFIEEIRRQRLALLIKEAGSQTRLAHLTGKGQVQISQWLNATPDNRGKPRVMSSGSARQLEEAMGKPEGWMDQPLETPNTRFMPARDRRQPIGGGLVAERAASAYEAPAVEPGDEFVPVPRVRFKLSAGASGYAVEYLQGTRAPIWFRRDWFQQKGLRPGKVFACDVTGSSMESGLHAGDTVLVNTESATPKDGVVFAAMYEGEPVVKRLRRNAGEWWLASDNSDQVVFAPKLCDEHCTIVGEVVHKQSEWI